jgi:hypothetical protein
MIYLIILVIVTVVSIGWANRIDKTKDEKFNDDEWP